MTQGSRRVKYALLLLLLLALVVVLIRGYSRYSEGQIIESVDGLSFADLYADPPWNVAWSAFDEDVDMYERCVCVEMVEGVIIGVCEGFYEFAPDHNPPTQGEKLAWIWFLRPDLIDEIRPTASPDMTEMMERYQEGTIYDWIQEYPYR